MGCEVKGRAGMLLSTTEKSKLSISPPTQGSSLVVEMNDILVHRLALVRHVLSPREVTCTAA